MKRIKKIIKEIVVSLRRIETFFILIKTLVFLTVSYLVFFMLNIDPIYAFIPAIVYFMSSLFVIGRVDQLRKVERKYNDLNEKLRTARDYRKKDSIVLDMLEDDIVVNLKKVKLSNFFQYTKAVLLVMLLIISVSSSLYVASKNIRTNYFNELVDNARKRFTENVEEKFDEVDFTGTDESIMQVGDERIQVEINPVGMDLDFSEEADIGEYEFTNAFPREVFISSGAAYETEFTEEQQALIKRYFEKIKKI